MTAESIDELIDHIRDRLNPAKQAPNPVRRTGCKMFNPAPLPPPASPQEIAKAEELIGFPLPALLKALYARVGNGGFGPGYGLFPLFAKSKRPTDAIEAAIDFYLLLREVDLEADLELDDEPSSKGFDASWPPMLIPICTWGCAITGSVDCSKPNLPIVRNDPNSGRRTREAESLEKWLSDWVAGKNE